MNRRRIPRRRAIDRLATAVRRRLSKPEPHAGTVLHAELGWTGPVDPHDPILAMLRKEATR